MRWLGGVTDSMDMDLSKLREIVKDRKPGVLQSMWCCRGSDVTEQLQMRKLSSVKQSECYEDLCQEKMLLEEVTFPLISKE